MQDDLPKAPIVINPIPPLVMNEGATFGPFDLLDYVRSPDEVSGELSFEAGLADGNGLPAGLMCTVDGFISGLPPIGTAGEYDIELTVTNASGIPLILPIPMTIQTRPALDDASQMDVLKTQIWDALGKGLPLPDLASIMDRPITATEIYYLLQKFAVLTIWDVYNLEPAGDLVALMLPNASKHYHIYDRGSCLVAAPKELFSHERTLADSLQTAKALAQEVYKRGWTIEFSGFNKMVKAAWVEVQILGQKHNKPLDIMHYTPTDEDLKLYTVQSQAANLDGPSLS
jgi:hypothetical protein